MDIEDAIQRLEVAQGDPEALALATVDVVLSSYAPVLYTALEAAAVPHWFDAKVLSALLETDEATANTWLDELSGLPMVESFAAREGWNVHEATRLALRNRMADGASSRFRDLSARAAQCFASDDPAWRVESTYHQLLAAPEEAADQLERLWKEWDYTGRHEQLQALGVALDELIRTGQLAPPARARSLLCLGWIRQSTLLLRKAEELAHEALVLFQQLQHEPGQADAHDQLGDILVDAGNLAEALRAYEASKAIRERLTERDPENTDWQRDLSVSHNYVGAVYEAQGRLAEALREYEASKAIRERLTERDPENTDWQRDLSVSHNYVGAVYQAQGRLAEALREYEADKAIMVRLTERDLENSGWQRDLSASHNSVGSVYQAQGRLAEALREYEAYKAIMARLTEQDPENSGWQRELSVSHNCVGAVYQAQGRLAEALREYEADKAIMARLTECDPENSGWQRDLSVSHNCVGAVYEAQGRLAEALREYEADLAIAERLTIQDTENNQWLKDLAVTRAALDRLREKMDSQS